MLVQAADKWSLGTALHEIGSCSKYPSALPARAVFVFSDGCRRLSTTPTSFFLSQNKKKAKTLLWLLFCISLMGTNAMLLCRATWILPLRDDSRIGSKVYINPRYQGKVLRMYIFRGWWRQCRFMLACGLVLCVFLADLGPEPIQELEWLWNPAFRELP